MSSQTHRHFLNLNHHVVQFKTTLGRKERYCTERQNPQSSLPTCLIAPMTDLCQTMYLWLLNFTRTENFGYTSTIIHGQIVYHVPLWFGPRRLQRYNECWIQKTRASQLLDVDLAPENLPSYSHPWLPLQISFCLVYHIGYLSISLPMSLERHHYPLLLSSSPC